MNSFSSLIPAVSSLAFTAPPRVGTNSVTNAPHNGINHRLSKPVGEGAVISRIHNVNSNSARAHSAHSRLSAIAMKLDPNDDRDQPWGMGPWSPNPENGPENGFPNIVESGESKAEELTQPGPLQSFLMAFDPKRSDSNGASKASTKGSAKETPPFKFISADNMQLLKSRYKTQASTLDSIKEKFLFHDTFEKDKALQLFLMDSQGLSLTMATEIAEAHGRGCYVFPPNTNLNNDSVGKLLQFMHEHPDGVVVVPSINNRNPAIFPPEFMAARGLPVDISSVFQFSKLAQEGININPQSPPIVSKNKFLFVIANKNINNPDKIYGFHNKDVDTTQLNTDIFMAYMGVASQKYQTDHNSILMLENRGLSKEEYTPLVESFLPEELSDTDREEVIEFVKHHANEKTDYREFKHLAADKVASILSERYD